MTKQACIEYIAPILKADGYLREKNSWYKENGDMLFCIQIQSSQWAKDDYFCNLMISVKGYFDPITIKKLNYFSYSPGWIIYLGLFNGLLVQENIPPSVFLKKARFFFDTLSSKERIKALYKMQKKHSTQFRGTEFRVYCESKFTKEEEKRLHAELGMAWKKWGAQQRFFERMNEKWD
ncbi:MAG: DUF4304 domain-containing protein [Firmicutes bacterium]|nr:DUF4304 domain-containing protein [Bacillota bacterium]